MTPGARPSDQGVDDDVVVVDDVCCGMHRAGPLSWEGR